MDVENITPEELAALVKSHSDAELKERLADVDRGRAVNRILEEMPNRFKPNAASGVEADVVFEVLDEDQTHAGTISIKNDNCVAKPGVADDYKVKLTAPTVLFLKLITGKQDGPSAFMTGQLKIDGDIMLASRLLGFFELPQSA
jgi:putative sterol carrier protein